MPTPPHERREDAVEGVTWEWVSTVTPVERIEVAHPERYTLRLEPDGQVRARFDCNRGGGTYTLSADAIALGPLTSTRAACPPGSLDQEFMRDLQRVNAWRLGEDGSLFLGLPFDSGTLRFRRAGDGTGAAGVGDAPPDQEANAARLPESVANAIYAGIFDEPVRLSEGRYEGPPFRPGGTSRPRVMILPRTYVASDFDGDGAEEHVVALARSDGGSGTFLYLALLRQRSGTLVNTDTVPLGDRVRVLRLAAWNDTVRATLLVHAPDDPACCPSLEVTRSWTVRAGRLSETARQPEGFEEPVSTTRASTQSP